MRLVPTLMMAAVLAATSSARADEKDVCASSSEYAQRLLAQGKMIEARGQLLICTRMVCPAVVKQDCDGWLSTLDATIPSLVVAARDEEGRDLLDLKVTLDGAAVDPLNGRAVPVDPGVHRLRVEAAGKLPVEQRVVVHEGERARPVTVTLASPAKPAGARGGAPQPPPERPTSPFVYILGTLAGVSFASFAAFEIKASVQSSHLRSTCAPRCSASEVDGVSTDTVIANVSLALGAAFAGGAVAVWYFGKKGQRGQPPAAALEIGPSRIGLHGTF
ncbi:hypothetical protein LZC95_35915 [Pendulispora brunnea]|uniref:Uncharacterized protein n=1 Tax=Pendulispora brunnea TaxID=2905690 RepID=A0ABZ2JZB2_9BACT